MFVQCYALTINNYQEQLLIIKEITVIYGLNKLKEA